VDSEVENKSRRSPEELVTAIFELLPENGLITINELSEKLGSKWSTVEDYLRLIEWIQQQPRIESMHIGIRRYGWKKIPEKKGRKTK